MSVFEILGDLPGILQAVVPDQFATVLQILTFFGLLPKILYEFLRLRKQLRGVVTDPEAVWKRQPHWDRVDKYKKQIKNTIPVLSLVNAKGGVGKSMICSNLAAYFDQLGLRVLLVDLGHNATLTEMVPIANRDNKDGSFYFSALELLNGRQKYRPPEKLSGSFQRSWIYPASHDLKKADHELALSWLTGARARKGRSAFRLLLARMAFWKKKRDIRFHVHDFLSQPEVQNSFDLVLIDTTNEQSAALANALCASTHVLVPTVLDMSTTPTTVNSLKNMRDFRLSLLLNYAFMGVVPSQVSQVMNAANQFTPREEQAFGDLKARIDIKFDKMMRPGTVEREKLGVLRDQYICNRVALRHQPGDDLIIFSDQRINVMFLELGDVISDRFERDNMIYRARLISASPGRVSASAANTPPLAQQAPVSAADVPAQAQPAFPLAQEGTRATQKPEQIKKVG